MNNYKQVEKEEFDQFIVDNILVESYVIPSARADRPDERVHFPKDGNYPQDVKAIEEIGENPKYLVIE